MIPMLGSPWDLGIMILILLFSASFHESAHAWVAWKCGDDSAKREGRVSLNPAVHICPYLTIMMPIFLYIASHGTFIFGGAKPVMVHPQNLRKPEKDMMLVAAAGPISNLLIFLVASIFLAVATKISRDPMLISLHPTLFIFWLNVMFLNISLALFNLLPFPPLDGSRIITFFIPPLRELYQQIEQFGFVFIITLLVIFPQLTELVSYACVSIIKITSKILL